MRVTGEITYTKKKLIGEGHSAKVYLADDAQLGGIIAVKEIPKTHFRGSVAEFFSEAQAMFAVAHENIVPILCAFQTSDLICLAMRYYKNGSLYDLCSANPLQPKEVVRIGQGILAGLASIHSKDFIHFDIKPSNVLFSDRRVPMLADFGQTRPVGPAGITRSPALYPAGIPPECYSGVGTVHSDIYHAGLTLYRAANGNALFEKQKPADPPTTERLTLAGKFPDRNRFLPHVPPRLRTVIRKAIAVDPADRYQSASDFADDLAHVRVALDWSVSISPDGEIQWRAERSGHPAIVVELSKSNSSWGVTIHKIGSAMRAYRSGDWFCDVTRNQALAHLKRLFPTLG